MKPLSLIKPAILFLLISASCNLPTQAQMTKNVAISNFSEVSVSAGIELIITQGSTESAKIIAKEGVIDEVEIEKSGNSVHVGWRENLSFTSHFKNRSAKVYISYKKLNSIAASSGSSLVTENVLKTDKLDARASSGASIKAKISCNDLDLQTSSGGSASLSGNASNMDVSASSGGNVDALDLITAYAKARTSSGGDVEINVTKGLETATSSGGSIRYKGTAALNNTSSRNNRGGVRHID